MINVNKIHDVITVSYVVQDKGKVSDGYHTFDELYSQRMMLFCCVCKAFPSKAWKSHQHYDGTMYDGYFIAGIKTPEGNFTYHFKMSDWFKFDVPQLDKAPEWDGHTADDVSRLLSLF